MLSGKSLLAHNAIRLRPRYRLLYHASSETAFIRLDPTPLLFSSPVSTVLPNEMTDEQEEEDISTLGRPEPEEDP
jgi:hypothetical protein